MTLILLQVGKTSLINALKEGTSEPIAVTARTVSLNVSRQLLDGVDLRIWDFAGDAPAAVVVQKF